MKAYIHADDFGIAQHQVEALIKLAEEGAIESVSILANDPLLPEHVTALRAAAPNTRLTVHLNFVEGESALGAEALPDLTDERGYFRLSYGRLLLSSLLPGRRRRLMGELIAEASAQLTAIAWCQPLGLPLAADTHQHTLAIPLVFRAVLCAIHESGIPITELRIPREPLSPYLRHPTVLFSIPAVNFVKLGLINCLMLFNRRAFRNSGLTAPVFAGVLMTDGVDEQHVERVLPDLIQYAKKRKRNLEILFHPARVHLAEECPDAKNKPFVLFNTSPRRDEEGALVEKLKGVLDQYKAEGIIGKS